MAEPNNYITATRKNFVSNDNEGRMVEKCIVEIQGTFLVKIRDHAFNGNVGENASSSEWFTKECIGSITTWDNMVEKFFIKFHHLSDHDEEEETEEDDNPNEMDNVPEIFKIEGNLFDFKTPSKGTEEPWLENRVPYQLCDHVCEPYRLKNGETKWPMCTSDIDGFCNGGELPGMVRVGSITYFQDHRIVGRRDSRGDEILWMVENSFKNFHDLDYDVLVKLQECWWKVNAHEIAPFTRIKNFGWGPYANMKTEWTSNPYLDVNHIFGRNYEASNIGDAQENQGQEKHKGNPNPEPSNCKIRRFEMMKYSFNDDEEYITIKESEHLNHSKDSLDAYRELLRLIDEGWVVTTPDEWRRRKKDLAETMIWYILKKTCNGYIKNGQKRSQNGQNRAWDWKSVRKAKLEEYSILMGQPVTLAIPSHTIGGKDVEAIKGSKWIIGRYGYSKNRKKTVKTGHETEKNVQEPRI
ncbi:hypothetical protein Tco_1246785 [Tanacetum coccineum]